MERWETLTHQSPLAGLAQKDVPAGGVVLVGCLAAGGAAALSVALIEDLGVFFGILFVLVSVTCALAADAHSLYAPAVLPPLLMGGVIAVVSIVAPESITVDGLADSAGVLQRTIAGVVNHATALVVGHLLALGIIAARIIAAPDDDA